MKYQMCICSLVVKISNCNCEDLNSISTYRVLNIFCILRFNTFYLNFLVTHLFRNKSIIMSRATVFLSSYSLW